MSSSGWSRVLWGVVFSSGMNERPMLLGSLWETWGRSAEAYKGEPTRALLIISRAEARRRFRVVRVRESVEPA